VFLFVAAFSDGIVGLLAGEEYGPAAPILSLLGLYNGAAALLGMGLCTHFLFVIGLQKLDLALRVSAAVLNIVLDVALIPAIGPLGAAVATVTANLAVLGIELALVLVRYRAGFPAQYAAKLILAYGSALTVAWLWLRTANPILAAGLYLVLAILMVRLLKPWTQGDIEALTRTSPRLARLLSVVAGT
jgi:O-antigen/teichoic acid export membrane protein